MLLFDQETKNLMQDFFDSVEYQSEVKDWQTEPETFEDPDDEESIEE